MLGMKKRIFVGVMCALLCTALSSRASIVTFTGIDDNPSGNSVRIAHPNSDAAQISFLSNLVGAGTETFESFAPSSTPLLLTFTGAGTATFTGDPVIRREPTGTDGNGRYPISGDQYLEADTLAFSITFSQAVAAFGFYGVDIGDFGGTLTLHLGNGGLSVLTVPTAPIDQANSSVLYYGFYGTTAADVFNSISFANSNTQDVFAFDDMTIGSLQQVQVPEPASVTLLGLGIVGLIGLGWRQRKLAPAVSRQD